MDRSRVIGIKSLGDWLQTVESIGELKRIKAQVDWDLEMATITYMAGKTVGGPALLFENIKDYADRVCVHKVVDYSFDSLFGPVL